MFECSDLRKPGRADYKSTPVPEQHHPYYTEFFPHDQHYDNKTPYYNDINNPNNTPEDPPTCRVRHINDLFQPYIPTPSPAYNTPPPDNTPSTPAYHPPEPATGGKGAHYSTHITPSSPKESNSFRWSSDGDDNTSSSSSGEGGQEAGQGDKDAGPMFRA